MNYPNGWRNWFETCVEMTLLVGQDLAAHPAPKKLEEYREAGGYTAIHDVVLTLTNGFEKLYKGRFWDGEWLEAVEQYYHQWLNDEPFTILFET